MKLFIVLFIFLLPIASWSNYEKPKEVLEPSSEEFNPSMQDLLLKKKEKYQRDEAVIYELNSNLGIKDKRFFTGSDKAHFSASYAGSADINSFMKLNSINATLMARTKNYSRLYLGGMLKITQAQFSLLTNNQTPDAGDNTHDESQYQRPDTTKTTLTTIGLGAGYRFKLLLDFMKTTDVFEQVNVFGTYNTWKESYIGKSYKGYGFTADYTLVKRTSQNFFYGMKYSYNFATLERPAIGTEKAKDRSFAISYSTLGFELGVVFQ